MTSPRTALSKTAEIPVSWGELIDKITILEIKRQRLASPQARANVERELSLLTGRASPLLSMGEGLPRLKAGLAAVNGRLWEIEDQIRKKEALGLFDEEFIRLARAVYITNDERARIKKEINTLTSSELTEEKSYAPYDRR